jgi:hypothetical protein
VLHELDRADIEQGLIVGRIDLAHFLASNLRNAAAIDTEAPPALRSADRARAGARLPSSRLGGELTAGD